VVNVTDRADVDVWFGTIEFLFRHESCTRLLDTLLTARWLDWPPSLATQAPARQLRSLACPDEVWSR